MDLFSHSGFSINRHFQRSIRIDNDISKEFLEHFIFHDTGKKVLNQIANSFMNTNQSGFTLTGPYGTGKSSLALFLQALVNDNAKIKKTRFSTSIINRYGFVIAIIFVFNFFAFGDNLNALTLFK